jgi:hypothetical protein
MQRDEDFRFEFTDILVVKLLFPDTILAADSGETQRIIFITRLFSTPEKTEFN